MKVEIEIQNPNESPNPGIARENLAKLIGWKRMRELFPKEEGR